MPDLGLGFNLDMPPVAPAAQQSPMPDLGMGLDVNTPSAPESSNQPNVDLGGFNLDANAPAASNQPASGFNFGNLDDLGNTQAPQASSGLPFDNIDDDDTPLPPMKPATPPAQPKKAAKKNNDIFASLFNDAGNGGGDGLDLNLDVLEVFPSGDQGNSSQAAPQKSNNNDSDPFNLGSVLDLDSMMGSTPAPGEKDSTGTFNLDDFDISKFKL